MLQHRVACVECRAVHPPPIRLHTCLITRVTDRSRACRCIQRLPSLHSSVSSSRSCLGRSSCIGLRRRLVVRARVPDCMPDCMHDRRGCMRSSLRQPSSGHHRFSSCSIHSLHAVLLQQLHCDCQREGKRRRWPSEPPTRQQQAGPGLESAAAVHSHLDGFVSWFLRAGGSTCVECRSVLASHGRPPPHMEE